MTIYKGEEYQTFVEYDDKNNGYHSILGYYCNCQVGTRTIGCCSHVASVIYYLSYGRYQEIEDPANTLSNLLTEFTPIVDASDEEIEQLGE